MPCPDRIDVYGTGGGIGVTTFCVVLANVRGCGVSTEAGHNSWDVEAMHGAVVPADAAHWIGDRGLLPYCDGLPGQPIEPWILVSTYKWRDLQRLRDLEGDLMPESRQMLMGRVMLTEGLLDDENGLPGRLLGTVPSLMVVALAERPTAVGRYRRAVRDIRTAMGEWVDPRLVADTPHLTVPPGPDTLPPHYSPDVCPHNHPNGSFPGGVSGGTVCVDCCSCYVCGASRAHELTPTN